MSLQRNCSSVANSMRSLSSVRIFVSHVPSMLWFLQRAGEWIGFVASFDGFFGTAVLLSELLSIVYRTSNIFGPQVLLVDFDGDNFLVVGAFVFGRKLQDAVGVDFEDDFHLKHATGSWRYDHKVEFSCQINYLHDQSFSTCGQRFPGKEWD